MDHRWKAGLAAGLAALGLLSAAPALASDYWQVSLEGYSAILDGDALKPLPGDHRLATFYFAPEAAASDGEQWLTERQVEMDCTARRVRIIAMRQLDRNLATVNQEKASDDNHWLQADNDEMGRALVELTCASPADRGRHGKKIAGSLKDAIAPFAARIAIAPAPGAATPEEPSCAPGGQCAAEAPVPTQAQCDANGACDAAAPAPQPRNR